MPISSEFCRIQQRAHVERAIATPLANVRTIEERAATAWGREAAVATERERRDRARDERIRAADAMRMVRSGDCGDPSENPDRRTADTTAAL